MLRLPYGLGASGITSMLKGQRTILIIYIPHPYLLVSQREIHMEIFHEPKESETSRGISHATSELTDYLY